MARRLKSHGDVRRYLANVINRLEKGELDPQIAGKLGYLAGILLKALEGAEIADRLTNLEERIRRLTEESAGY